ncbi:hypothetical protein yaldo0001_21160 [Yersinia aldovae ATCC 35236]|nr:hypothetical protein yaldo0001_21160 [Yersinia aldovae ATCC 35236]
MALIAARLNGINLSYFKLHVRWLLSLTRINDWRQLIGVHSLAAFLQLELFRV